MADQSEDPNLTVICLWRNRPKTEPRHLVHSEFRMLILFAVLLAEKNRL